MKNVVKMASILLALMLVASCSDLLLDEEVDAAKPEIVVQPLNVVTNENNGYSLSVEARSTDGGNLYYEWYMSSHADMSDAVSAGTLPEVSVAHPESGIYYYYCKITNKNEGWDVSGKTTADINTEKVKVSVANGEYGYIVEHYQQNIQDDGYTLVPEDTEPFVGIRDALTEAEAKSYTGFTARQIEQKPVKKDGSTIVQVYYDRKTQTISFDTTGGEEIDPVVLKYGDILTELETPVKGKYIFDGWYVNEDFTGERVTSVDGSELNDDKTIYAKWLKYKLMGTSEQAQGDIIKNGIEINGSLLPKTGEVVVIPSGMEAVIYSDDDSNWEYPWPSAPNDRAKGVFLKDRKVKLSPFAMGQYEVTVELYKAVMGALPASCETESLNAVTHEKWFETIIFCNKLSLMEDLEPVYSLIIDGENVTDPDLWPDCYTQSGLKKRIWDSLQTDITKNGYRLATEAEWEYAARGGNPDCEEWMYKYSGSNTLSEVGWNAVRTKVGQKKCNRLHLYDMSGNVCEWCFDIVTRDDYEDITIDDDFYTIDDCVVNPMGRREGIYRCLRGGDRDSWCIVTKRDGNDPYQGMTHYGFRLVRSLTD